MLSTTSFAQIRNAELNIFGAGSIYSKNTYVIGYPQAITSIPGETKFDTRGRFGVRFGVYTRGRWGEEFFYSVQPNTVHISQGGTAPKTTDVKVRISNYGVNALYYLQETETHAFQPFLSAGLGGGLYQIRQSSAVFLQNPAGGNLQDMNNSNELVFNYGFGFKTHSTGWFGVRFDVRDYFGRTPSFGLARHSTDPTAEVLPVGSLHNAEASVGVVFYFGKR
jgi:hypothetical protein